MCHVDGNGYCLNIDTKIPNIEVTWRKVLKSDDVNINVIAL